MLWQAEADSRRPGQDAGTGGVQAIAVAPAAAPATVRRARQVYPPGLANSSGFALNGIIADLAYGSETPRCG